MELSPTAASVLTIYLLGSPFFDALPCVCQYTLVAVRFHRLLERFT
jgi:hypothetical protein